MVVASLASRTATVAMLSQPSVNMLGIEAPSQWIVSSATNHTVGLLAVIAVSALLFMLNTTFNMLRSLSLVYASVFLSAMVALPVLSGGLYGGLILAAAVIGSLYPLFSVYQSPGLTRRIFLSFLIATCGLIVAAQVAAWVVVILTLFVGMVQMRVMRLRTVAAALLGVVTPVWILWGFGFVGLPVIAAPAMTDINVMSIPVSMAYVAYCILLWVGMSVFNIIRIYNYNARLRAFNGTFLMMGFSFLVLIIIDSQHLTTYLPTFIACMSMQAGHLFAIVRGPRSWIGILVLLASIWNFYFLSPLQ